MNFNEYIIQVKSDAKDVITKSACRYDDWDDMYDDLFVDDSVTGNGSGSYTFNHIRAQEYTKDLFWDDDFIEACREMGYENISDVASGGPEGMDVIARCLALGYCSSILEDYFDEVREEAEAQSEEEDEDDE